MVVPFGVGIGDFLAVSKLIGRIVLELSKNGKSSAEYQGLLLELDLLDKALRSVQSLRAGPHDDSMRLATVRALATTCKLPLEAFLKKVEKFDDRLGVWKGGNNRLAGLPRRMQWSLMFTQDVKDLRAKLAAHSVTITLLLMTKTSDALAKAEKDRNDFAVRTDQRLLCHGVLLESMKQDTQSHVDSQAKLEAGQDQLLSNIKSHAAAISRLEQAAGSRCIVEEQQHRAQDQRLDLLQDIANATESSVTESLAMTVSMNNHTSEVVSTSRSILSVALEVLHKVSSGMLQAQDLAREMALLVETISIFTAEMRQRMTELLRMFADIQILLQRLGKFLPKPIDLPTVRFRDAFNELRPLPFDLCREWKTFKGLVAVIFTDRQGLHRVQRGQFIVNHLRFGRQLNPAFWRNAVEPGDELSMAMLLPDRHGKEGSCPWDDCGASTESIELTFGGKVCNTCLRWAAVLPTNKTDAEIAANVESRNAGENPAVAPMAPSVAEPKWKTEQDEPFSGNGTATQEQMALDADVELSPELEEDFTLYHFVTFALIAEKASISLDSTDKATDKIYHSDASQSQRNEPSTCNKHQKKNVPQDGTDYAYYDFQPSWKYPRPAGYSASPGYSYSLPRYQDYSHFAEKPTYSVRPRVRTPAASTTTKSPRGATDCTTPSKVNQMACLDDPADWPYHNGHGYIPRILEKRMYSKSPQRRPSTTFTATKARRGAKESNKRSQVHLAATVEDAKRAGIPAGYSIKHWDPMELPIILLGSVFDANSLGKWMFDWTIFVHGGGTPLTEIAGDLWLLLIKLNGKLKCAEERFSRIQSLDAREMIEDFMESGDRIWERFKKLLKRCETYLWHAAKKAGTKDYFKDKKAGVEFVDSILGRDRELQNTEKLMTSMRLWILRFDANCEEILRPQTSSAVRRTAASNKHVPSDTAEVEKASNSECVSGDII